MQLGQYSVYIQAGSLEIGCKRHTLEEWEAFDDAEIKRMDIGALAFWRTFGPALLALAKANKAFYCKAEASHAPTE